MQAKKADELKAKLEEATKRTDELEMTVKEAHAMLDKERKERERERAEREKNAEAELQRRLEDLKMALLQKGSQETNAALAGLSRCTRQAGVER